MRTPRKKAWTLVAGAMLALLLAATAHGATGIRTWVTLNGSDARHGARFRGAVFTMAPLEGKGDKDACLVDRKVVLFRKTDKGPKKVKSAHTDDAGDYSLKINGTRRHRYFAKATRVALADRYGNLVLCEADVSDVVKL